MSMVKILILIYASQIFAHSFAMIIRPNKKLLLEKAPRQFNERRIVFPTGGSETTGRPHTEGGI